MRPLSASMAAKCEHATAKRCRCRCGGAMHGAARVSEDEHYWLPDDDPHKVRPPESGVQLRLDRIEAEIERA